MDPFITSALITSMAGLFGMGSQQSANAKATQAANEQAAKNQAQAEAFTREMTNLSYEQQQKMYAQQRADAINAATLDYSRSIAAMDKANAFTASQSEAARAHDAHMYQVQRADNLSDMEQQYVRQRAAAEAAGINPLTALGVPGAMPMPPSLASSSFGASASPPQSVTSIPPAPGGGSVPMAYGAPVAVTPIASNEAVIGSVSELGRELTGAAAIERANLGFFQDVAKIEAEKDIGLKYPAVAASQGMPVMGNTAVPAPPVQRTPGGPGITNAGAGVPTGRTRPPFLPRDGYAPTYSGESPVSDLGAESRPDVVASGLSLLSNRFLYDSRNWPYFALGDADEALNMENLPVNGPLLAGQAVGRVQDLAYMNRTPGAFRSDGQMFAPYPGTRLERIGRSFGLTADAIGGGAVRLFSPLFSGFGSDQEFQENYAY